ncbi:phosphate acyltransferase PlsX [Pseudoroseicyclus aestuarii]|uniref:Phosphate acyltransferase n=1 Tax=Pseudoroseicyclus aestuarii TaxID=1795041 RepID=A0A318SQ54_9RHOB|nr:phosphate acyltransferase PlsX [Pseudoroseicyclus aestuarii]PYE84000.1 phosphate:acyl-[acyl carrier protein] acyltransferase [Pseudoroseicyclus aestuarii]
MTQPRSTGTTTGPAAGASGPSSAPADEVTIAVDAMGGDSGPRPVVEGLKQFLAKDPGARVLLFGDEAQLRPLLDKQGIDRLEVIHASDVVSMTDKPSQVMRHGKDTSMWGAVDAVRDGRAGACVSCGNTGALMAVSMLRLRKAEGVDRPAIGCLWPSTNPGGFNLMLDVGADVRADQHDLLTYAVMGAAYAAEGLNLERPRVGLLNVGTEEHKGRAELKVAHELIGRSAEAGGFDYIGFVEGGDIPSDRVDVVVTDGFTGNVALKTGEGTSRLISSLLQEAFRKTWLSRIAAGMAMASLKRLRKRIDPRRVNGGVFLGLGGTVVKSHGSADATGVAAALKLSARLARSDFTHRLASRVAAAPQRETEQGDEASQNIRSMS